jgi:RNA polymerase sigma-70 factor (ECF subfamily)
MKENESRLKALRVKDPEAYRQLMNEVGDSLYHVALRIVKNQEKAQEIVQEVFLKMVKNIDRFEGRSTLKTWLYRIAVNESLMSQRKELPRLDDSIEELLPHYEANQLKKPNPEWAKDPERLADDHEFHAFYKECLHKLPETLRTAYVLKDVENLSEDAICEILGITKSAIKNRAHRARLMLRHMIGERYGH